MYRLVSYTHYKYRGMVERYKCKYQDGQYEMTAFENGSLSPAVTPCWGPSFLIDLNLSENFNERDENAELRNEEFRHRQQEYLKAGVRRPVLDRGPHLSMLHTARPAPLHFRSAHC